jgi:comEA protein
MEEGFSMKTKNKLLVVCLTLMVMVLIPFVVLAEPMGEKGEAVNINEASVEELSNLKGMDTAKASAILEYITSHGPFTAVEELKNVKGIDEQTFQNIKDSITVEPEKEGTKGMHKKH